jgi:hypothetical protein
MKKELTEFLKTHKNTVFTASGLRNALGWKTRAKKVASMAGRIRGVQIEKVRYLAPRDGAMRRYNIVMYSRGWKTRS